LGYSSDVAIVGTILEDESVYLWKELIGQYIPEIFQNEHFPHLAVIIEERIPTFLWKEMVDAAAIYPKLAENYIKEISPIINEASARTAASLITGIARSNPAWANDRMLSLFNGNKYELLASLRAIQLCIDEKTPHHEYLVKTVLTIDIPQDEAVLRYYLCCLCSIHALMPQLVESRMIELMNSGSSDIRNRIILNSYYLATFSTDARIQIVKEAISKREGQLFDNIVFLLVKIYENDRIFPLSIIRTIAEEELLGTAMGQFDHYLLSEIGKIDRHSAFHAINSWFDDNPSDTLLFQISDILVGIFGGKPNDLVDLTRVWKIEEIPRFRTRIEILRNLLCERVEKDHDVVVIRCAEEVIAISDLSPFEYSMAVEGETDIGYWALRVLKAITSPWGKVDYERVFQNLERFPNIKRFLDAQWLEQMRRKSDDNVAILHMLDCEDDDFLSYWDDVFQYLDFNKPGIGRLRSDLRNYPRIRDILSEAEVISRIGRKYPVDVKISVKGLGSEPDLRPHLTGQAPILEVYTPEEERKLLYAGGGSLDTDRIKIKVLEKFKKQFKQGASLIEDPVVFVIHSEGMTITDYDIMNVLFGTFGIKIYFDKVSGKSVGQCAYRENDSIHDIEKDAGLISGFLVYHRNVRKPADRALHVEYFPNPRAWHPLTKISVEELCSALSKDWTMHHFSI